MKVRRLELPNYPIIYTLEDFYSEKELESILEQSRNVDSFGDFNQWFADYNKSSASPGDRHISEIETPTESRTKVEKLWNAYRPSRCVPIDDLETGFMERIQIVAPGYDYPVHTDSIWKAMTIIIYLDGEQGTVFTGNNNDQNGFEIEFKKNCGYMFFPDQLTTWHYFKNSTDRPRSTTTIHKTIHVQSDEEIESLFGHRVMKGGANYNAKKEYSIPDLVKIDFTDEYHEESRIPPI